MARTNQPDQSNGTADTSITINEMMGIIQDFQSSLVTNLGNLSRQSWLRGSGMDQKRDIDQECDYPKSFSAEDYQRLYDWEAIPNRIVQVLPKETWQVQPTVYEDEDPDEVTEFEKAVDELSSSIMGEDDYYESEEGSLIWEYMLRADILSGIGQYGILLLGLDDNEDFSTPARRIEETGSQPKKIIREKGANGNIDANQFLGTNFIPSKPDKLYRLSVNQKKQPNKLLYLRVFPESLAIASSYESNPTSPRFGFPVTYTVTFNDPRINTSGIGLGLVSSSFEVHWSRIIHIADNLESSEVFGKPRMQSVRNRLLDLRKLYGPSAEMYWQGAFPGINFGNPPQLGGNIKVDKVAFKEQMEQYFNGLQRWMFNKNLTPTMLSPTVVSAMEQIKYQLEAICIQIDIPMRKFMGSERGELASSDDDDDWNDVLRHRQKYYVTPKIIRPFVNRCISLGILPVPESGKWKCSWPDLTAQSELNKADVATKRTSAIVQFVNGGGPSVMTMMDFYTRIMGFSEEEAQAIIDNALTNQEEADDETLSSPLLGTVGGITAVTGMFKEFKAGSMSEESFKQLLMLFFNLTEERASDIIADGLPEPPAPPSGMAPIVPGVKPGAPGTQGGIPPGKPTVPGQPPPKAPNDTTQQKQPKVAEKEKTTENAFCPTGPGGGQDNSCGSGSSGNTPDRPAGNKDWAKLIKKHSEKQLGEMADRIISKVNEESFTKQVEYQAGAYQGLKGPSANPNALMARAAIETYVSDRSNQVAGDRIKGMNRGASAGHNVGKDDIDAAWKEAWKIATSKDSGMSLEEAGAKRQHDLEHKSGLASKSWDDKVREMVQAGGTEADARKFLTGLYGKGESTENFDPSQVRDEHGRWSSGGGGSSYVGLVERISKPDGGFTYSPTTGNSPTTGYALSPYPDRSFAKDAKDLTLDDMVEFVIKNDDLLSREGHHIGGWHDPASGKVFLDVSIITQDRNTAHSLALEKDQIAYFDLGEGKSVTVNPKATSGGTANRRNLNEEAIVGANQGKTVSRGASGDVSQAHRKGAEQGGDRGYQEKTEDREQVNDHNSYQGLGNTMLHLWDNNQWVSVECRNVYLKDGRLITDNAEAMTLIDNVFCPTGPGGGVDATCSPGGKGGSGGNSVSKESHTPPPPGKAYNPSVTADTNRDGVTDAARVGVPAMVVPPPPPVGRLPNLTPHEREVESKFMDAYNADPDGMATKFRKNVEFASKPGEPLKFETDMAKCMMDEWEHPNLSLEQRAINRATLNTPLHQTANAIAKRAFVQHLDTLQKGDEVTVTVGGCGCHVKDAPLMLSDGSTKLVQDIEVGDCLMGPDSLPREVLRLIRGRGKLYRVRPVKGKPFVVNEDHVLSIQTRRAKGSKKRTRICTVNMTVREVLGRGLTFIKNSWLHRTGVEFCTTPVALDPYFLGIWLGNGVHSLPRITTPHSEVVEYLEEFTGQFPHAELVVRDKDSLDGVTPNKAKDYQISLLDKHPGKGDENPVTQLLRQLGVLNNKHIPEVYLKNDRETRLRLLAGLLDTDGYLDNNCFQISSKDKQFANDIAYLVRSLGLAAYVSSKRVTSNLLEEKREYWIVSISGDTDAIPTRVGYKTAKKRVINKSVLRVGYQLEPVGFGDYYGFTLEGDGLYLMDDFTVTHNSGKGYALNNVPEAVAMRARSKVVWDSAGDQNATENPWIQSEAEKRGLKVNYVYVHAEPYKQWADPERGVVKRASAPDDGRMVDAEVYADSHVYGAKNHQAFYKANLNNPNANFVFIDNTGKPKKIDSIPQSALKINRDNLAEFAADTAMSAPVPPHIKRGATMGLRIWKKT